MLNIITKDCKIEGRGIINSRVDGKETILDSDLLIIDTDSVTKSIERLKDDYVNHVKKLRLEIENYLNHGKIAVIFIGELNEYHARADFFGGGGEVVNNYSFLPNDMLELLVEYMKMGSSSTRNSIVSRTKSNDFDGYFAAYKDELTYQIYFEDEPEINGYFFLENKLGMGVGLTIPFLGGKIVLLPKPKELNTPKLLSVLVDCAKNYFNLENSGPRPDWLSRYSLSGESILSEKIEIKNSLITEIELEKMNLVKSLTSLNKFKKLLFGTGKELESVVIKSLEILGFEAENYQENDMEHDVLFKSAEGCGLAEVEGKDNRAISITKLNQLNRIIDEDFERGDINQFKQGVLIGNHFRLTDPDKRKEAFTDKVKIFARKKEINLLSTFQLYKAVEIVLNDPENEELKKKFRKIILTYSGEIDFIKEM